jgi:hypothetical protein
MYNRTVIDIKMYTHCTLRIHIHCSDVMLYTFLIMPQFSYLNHSANLIKHTLFSELFLIIHEDGLLSVPSVLSTRPAVPLCVQVVVLGERLPYTALSITDGVLVTRAETVAQRDLLRIGRNRRSRVPCGDRPSLLPAREPSFDGAADLEKNVITIRKPGGGGWITSPLRKQ